MQTAYSICNVTVSVTLYHLAAPILVHAHYAPFVLPRERDKAHALASTVHVRTLRLYTLYVWGYGWLPCDVNKVALFVPENYSCVQTDS